MPNWYNISQNKEDWEFKVALDTTVSLKPAWAIWDPRDWAERKKKKASWHLPRTPRIRCTFPRPQTQVSRCSSVVGFGSVCVWVNSLIFPFHSGYSLSSGLFKEFFPLRSYLQQMTSLSKYFCMLEIEFLTCLPLILSKLNDLMKQEVLRWALQGWLVQI